MRKTKKSILASIAIFAMVAMSMPVFAAPGDRALPAEDDMFWYIFAEMNTPNDYDGCVAALDAYIARYPDIFNTDEIRNDVRSEMSQMCIDFQIMPVRMEDDMVDEGVTSNLFVAPDWHNVSGLYFRKEGMGEIKFTNTIDFMSYRFMAFMSDFQSMVKFDDGYISLNASMMTDMKYYGTQLTMLGLDFPTTPDIYVTDANGTTMHLATDSDISGVTYDPIAGTLTFNASHFSAFKAVTKGSKVKAMKIAKITPNKVKYNSKKSSFKITVKGKSLYKKGSTTTCTMGFEQSTKAKASKNGKKVVCTFAMSDFSTLGLYPVSITVAGQGQVQKANAVRVR